MAAELAQLGAASGALAVAIAADLAVGDPVYRLHPVRLIGDALQATERACDRSAPTATAAASRCSSCLQSGRCRWSRR
jgi:cobalamin biosynthesis protein CobD/CbiB